MKEYLQKINNGQDLLLDEMKSAINQIKHDEVKPKIILGSKLKLALVSWAFSFKNNK